VIFLVVVFTLLLFIFIAIILSACKEKALFVFREVDRTFITGGDHKTVLGGIIVIFFIVVSILICSGFIINFMVFNTKTVISETKNPYMNRDMPSSYHFNVTVYMSKFIETSSPFQMTVNNFQNMVYEEPPDL
jgi:cell division protein FtsL